MITAPARSVKRGRTWCGPYAIATVCGVDYDTAYDKAKKVLKKKRISGMWNGEVQEVARRLGTKFEWKHTKLKLIGKVGWKWRQPTLNQMLDELIPNRLYIIQVTTHYITVNTRDWTMVDNQTPEWKPVKDWKHGKKVVRAFAEVRRIAE
jgi:hypothetical protein